MIVNADTGKEVTVYQDECHLVALYDESSGIEIALSEEDALALAEELIDAALGSMNQDEEDED